MVFSKYSNLSTAFNISTNSMNKSKNTSTSEHARSSIVSDYEEGIQNKTLIMYSGKKKCNNHPLILQIRNVKSHNFR